MATNKKTAGANKPADKEKLTKAPEVEEVVQEEEPATEMVVEKPKAPDFAKTAAGLINKLRLSQVWRCQKTGYWFTREDYAQAHAKSADSKLEIYKK